MKHTKLFKGCVCGGGLRVAGAHANCGGGAYVGLNPERQRPCSDPCIALFTKEMERRHAARLSAKVGLARENWESSDKWASLVRPGRG